MLSLGEPTFKKNIDCTRSDVRVCYASERLKRLKRLQRCTKFSIILVVIQFSLKKHLLSTQEYKNYLRIWHIGYSFIKNSIWRIGLLLGSNIMIINAQSVKCLLIRRGNNLFCIYVTERWGRTTRAPKFCLLLVSG